MSVFKKSREDFSDVEYIKVSRIKYNKMLTDHTRDIRQLIFYMWCCNEDHFFSGYVQSKRNEYREYCIEKDGEYKNIW